MRLYYIINDFLNRQDYLNLDYFVETYKVSKRTIQNDIAFLMQVSSRKGYQLHMRRGKGYLLEVVNRQLLDEFIETLKVNEIYDTKDRVYNMVAYLATQKNFISMDNIADRFKTSKTLVKKGLLEVEEFIKGYQLKLERKSHYGIRITGSMKQYKTLLNDLFFINNEIIEDAFKEIMGDFSNVHSLLIEQIEKENLNINYNELKNVIVWLRVTVYYAYLTNEARVENVVKTNSWSNRIAYEMKMLLEEEYSIGINEESTALLEEKLIKNVRAKITKTSLCDRLSQDIDEFLTEIDKSYCTDFASDKEFKKSFA